MWENFCKKGLILFLVNIHIQQKSILDGIEKLVLNVEISKQPPFSWKIMWWSKSYKLIVLFHLIRQIGQLYTETCD